MKKGKNGGTNRRRVLVVGGSGGLGAHIIRRFELDDQVTTLRPPKSQAGFAEVAIEPEEKVDILIYAVGTEGEIAKLNDSHIDQWNETLRVNATGLYYFLKGDWVNESGRVVALSSVHALTGVPGGSAYAASKAALESLVKSAAVEFAPRRITVNAIRVGFMDAGMFHRLSERAKDLYISRVPAQEPGRPEDLAEFVHFICSRHAQYLTGQVIDFDGGYLANWWGR